jgi:hypothetical protein
MDLVFQYSNRLSASLGDGLRVATDGVTKRDMTEAVKLIVEYLFRTKDIERIEALTDTDNLASQGVLEKVGFKREGILRKRALIKGEYRDDLIYGILREEWIMNVDTGRRLTE